MYNNSLPNWIGESISTIPMSFKWLELSYPGWAWPIWASSFVEALMPMTTTKSLQSLTQDADVRICLSAEFFKVSLHILCWFSLIKCYLWLSHHSNFHKQTVEHAMEIGEVLTLDTVDLNWCHTHLERHKCLQLQHSICWI